MLFLSFPGWERVGGLGRGRLEAAGRGERAFWWGLQDVGKGQRAGEGLAVLPCLAFSAQEWHQLCRVPLLCRSKAAALGTRTEEAGREPAFKPRLGKWPSMLESSVSGKALGDTKVSMSWQGGLGPRQPAVCWAACGGVWPAREGGDPCPPLSAGQAKSVVLCGALGSPAQERCGATGESAAKGHAGDAGTGSRSLVGRA